MITVAQTCHVEIDGGELFTMAQPAGRTLEVLQGSIWITQDQDPRDLVLHAGEQIRIDKPQAMSVSAFRHGAFSISAAGCDCPA